MHADVVTRRITVDDVRWGCGLLARLSERQWDDAFHGAGYRQDVGRRFVRRILQKIDEGRTLGSSPFRSPGPVLP